MKTLQKKSKPDQTSETFRDESPSYDVQRATRQPLWTLQGKLTVNEPGDKYEREADRVAEQVMRSDGTDPTANTGESPKLQPNETSSESHTIETETAQQIESLKGSGSPLSSDLRSFFEPRFGYDFSDVRIHTGQQSDEAARSLNASAFTFGTNIAFQSGAYRDGSLTGRQLLAHELSHVVQQTGIKKAGGWSDEIVQRRVGSVRCTPGKLGVPQKGEFDPEPALRQIDHQAGALASATANIVAIAAEMLQFSASNSGGKVEQAFQNHFGLPPRKNGKYLNRLTTEQYGTRSQALKTEMRILAERFVLISDFLKGSITYNCVTKSKCSNVCSHDCDAYVSVGGSTINLCPSFWDFWPKKMDSAAALLIHEAAHTIWQSVGHEENFNHAECYASFVGDIFNIPEGTPPCPTPTMRFNVEEAENVQRQIDGGDKAETIQRQESPYERHMRAKEAAEAKTFSEQLLPLLDPSRIRSNENRIREIIMQLSIEKSLELARRDAWMNRMANYMSHEAYDDIWDELFSNAWAAEDTKLIFDLIERRFAIELEVGKGSKISQEFEVPMSELDRQALLRMFLTFEDLPEKHVKQIKGIGRGESTKGERGMASGKFIKLTHKLSAYRGRQFDKTLAHEVAHVIDTDEKYSGRDDFRNLSGWVEYPAGDSLFKRLRLDLRVDPTDEIKFKSDKEEAAAMSVVRMLINNQVSGYSKSKFAKRIAAEYKLMDLDTKGNAGFIGIGGTHRDPRRLANLLMGTTMLQHFFDRGRQVAPDKDNSNNPWWQEPFGYLMRNQYHEAEGVWWSYKTDARQRNFIRDYQFKSPIEEFAVVYATYHVTDGDGVPARFKSWFERMGLHKQGVGRRRGTSDEAG